MLTMLPDMKSSQVYVLCDYDALYAAIELKLSCLSNVHVIRLETSAADSSGNGHVVEVFDLLIVAPVPPINDPISTLSRASLLDHLGRVPVLIISEQPSKPESDDKITYLNFPFDMDGLTDTVAGILERREEVRTSDS